MNKRLVRAEIALLAVALSASLARAQFANPDLKSGKAVVHRVLILPPQASVTKSGMKGSDTLIQESSMLEAALPGIVSEAMQAKGCTVVENPFAPEALAKNQDLKYALSDIQGRFDGLRKRLDEKPKDVRNGRFTMGDDVANFNPGAQADALVFVRAQGIVHTGGMKTFGAIAGVNETDFVSIDIAVVDSQSGAVLYFARTLATGNFVRDPERMSKPVDRSFKEFAVSTKAGKKS